MVYRKFDELVSAVKSQSKRKRIAVVAAQDKHALESVLQARRDGLVEPILIGDSRMIGEILKELGETVDEFIEARDIHAAAALGVRLVREGRAHILMKAKIDTKDLLSAVVNKEAGLGEGRLMTFAAIHELPWYPKLLTVTDGGMTTYPTLEEKKKIIQNAVDALISMGYDKPKVAVLAAVEKVNPKMPVTVEAAELKRLNQKGEIKNCIVEGPISFDIAVNKQKAEAKEFISEVAGDADIVIVPDITAGNILGKALIEVKGARMAGLVLGAKAPIVLTSRGASTEEKYMSIALAALQ